MAPENIIPFRVTLADVLRAASLRLDVLLQRALVTSHPYLTRTHGLVLLRIPPEGIGLTALARQLGASKQAIARPVAVLQRFGYVALAKHPTDGRAVIIQPTARGAEFMRAALRETASLETELAADLGADRLGAFRELLTAVEAALAKRTAAARAPAPR